MYTVVITQRFKKSYKRVRQLPGFKKKTFEDVVTLLAQNEMLPPKYRDHALTGNLKDFRECHLAPDILLIYKKEADILMLSLINIGTHSQLFE